MIEALSDKIFERGCLSCLAIWWRFCSGQASEDMMDHILRSLPATKYLLSFTLDGNDWLAEHLCYSPLCVFPEIALQKLIEQKDISGDRAVYITKQGACATVSAYHSLTSQKEDKKNEKQFERPDPGGSSISGPLGKLGFWMPVIRANSISHSH